ncbi:MAG: metal ABC transporter permease, partial [Pseudomonadota bacterium]
MGPFNADLLNILALQGGYNTTVVSLGVAALGAAAALVGVFITLRGRAMVSDALGHATLPGVCIAFILGVMLFGEGRSLLMLSLGGLATALIALVCIHAISHFTRLTEDAANATVLGTFFGAGMVLLSAIQTMQTGGQAGLEGFLLGSTAGMLFGEAVIIGLAAAVIALIASLAFKEFLLVCIDRDYAEARGWAAGHIDAALLAAMLAVVVIGMKV